MKKRNFKVKESTVREFKQYGTPYVDEKEVFVILAVTTGSAMDKAGVEVGDFIISTGPGGLLADTMRNQGSNITFVIERHHTTKRITLHVPILHIKRIRHLETWLH